MKILNKTFNWIALFIFEWTFKGFAFAGALVAVLTQGTIMQRIVAGSYKIVVAVPQFFYKVKFNEQMYRDYVGKTNMSPAEFNGKYGNTIADEVMDLFNDFWVLKSEVTENWLDCLIAGMTIFAFFWILGRLMKFVRQKGQGSILVRGERHMGNRIWTTSGINVIGKFTFNILIALILGVLAFFLFREYSNTNGSLYVAFGVLSGASAGKFFIDAIVPEKKKENVEFLK